MNMQALDDYLLDAYDEPQEQEEREQFRIKNDDEANWAIRKIAKARKEFAEAERQAERERERIDAWLDGKRKAKERELVKLNQDFQRLQREFNEDRNMRLNEEIAAIQERTRMAIRQIAENEKFDLILQENEILYRSQRIDITDKVLKLLGDK